MLILAIESSCDETSIALLKSELNQPLDSHNLLQYLNSFRILGHTISTQIATHAQYGGVIPEIGARLHAEQIHQVFVQTVAEAITGLKKTDQGDFDLNTKEVREFLKQIDYICVTIEPGLMSALRVGHEFAKSIQFYLEQKLFKEAKIIKVNHLKGHIFSSFFDYKQENLTPQDTQVFPHLHLLVSGGNSQLLLLKSPFEMEIVGQTLDDAAGECFDKTARMFGLSYPGGVSLARIAGLEDKNYLDLPVSMLQSKDLNFSFSGLKTAVRYWIQKHPEIQYEIKMNDTDLITLKNTCLEDLQDPKLIQLKQLSISIQSVIIKQLSNKLSKAVEQYNPASLGFSGGVSANGLLRQKIDVIAKGKPVFRPDLSLTGDNAVMIALAGSIII